MAQINKVFFDGGTWMCRRDDGKIAMAIDSDVSVGTDTSDAVAIDAEEYWFPNSHDALHDAGIECGRKNCFRSR